MGLYLTNLCSGFFNKTPMIILIVIFSGLANAEENSEAIFERTNTFAHYGSYTSETLFRIAKNINFSLKLDSAVNKQIQTRYKHQSTPYARCILGFANTSTMYDLVVYENLRSLLFNNDLKYSEDKMDTVSEKISSVVIKLYLDKISRNQSYDFLTKLDSANDGVDVTKDLSQLPVSTKQAFMTLVDDKDLKDFKSAIGLSGTSKALNSAVGAGLSQRIRRECQPMENLTKIPEEF